VKVKTKDFDYDYVKELLGEEKMLSSHSHIKLWFNEPEFTKLLEELNPEKDRKKGSEILIAFREAHELFLWKADKCGKGDITAFDKGKEPKISIVWFTPGFENLPTMFQKVYIAVEERLDRIFINK